MFDDVFHEHENASTNAVKLQNMFYLKKLRKYDHTVP